MYKYFCVECNEFKNKNEMFSIDSYSVYEDKNKKRFVIEEGTCNECTKKLMYDVIDEIFERINND